MAYVVHERFMNFAGQACAKLNRDQAIYKKPTDTHSLLIRTVSPLLFFAPNVHLAMLERVWIDETINEVGWKSHVAKLNDEWREFVLFATVLCEINQPTFRRNH
jgi:hypothetical protein